MVRLIRPIFNKVGFEARANDQHLDVFLRSKVVSWACKLGLEECIQPVKATFSRWMKEEDPERTNP